MSTQGFDHESGFWRHILRRHSAFLFFVAIFLHFIGTLNITLSLFIPIIWMADGSPSRWPRAVALLVFGLASLAVGKWFRIHVLKRIQLPLSPLSTMESESYVLYLRPFGMDSELSAAQPLFGRRIWLPLGYIFHFSQDVTTQEEKLAHLFRRFGMLVAVGHPDEKYPIPGVTRFYLHKGAWKDEVGRLIKRARLIIFVAGVPGEGESAEGTLWEFSKAVRTLPPSRIIVLVCTNLDAYNRFREGVTAELSKRHGESLQDRVNLPDLSSHLSGQTTKSSLRGLIQFSDDWTPEFRRINPSTEPYLTSGIKWRLAVKQQLTPLLESLEEILPGRAVQPKFRWAHLFVCIVLAFLAVAGAIHFAEGESLPIRCIYVALVTMWVAGGIRAWLSYEWDCIARSVEVLFSAADEERYNARLPGLSRLDVAGYAIFGGCSAVFAHSIISDDFNFGALEGVGDFAFQGGLIGALLGTLAWAASRESRQSVYSDKESRSSASPSQVRKNYIARLKQFRAHRPFSALLIEITVAVSLTALVLAALAGKSVFIALLAVLFTLCGLRLLIK
ncbi:hypothetical protein [Streptomyces sp. NPDC002758]